MALGSLGAVVYDVVARDKTKEGLGSAEARARNMNKSALMVGAGMTAVGVGAKLMADNINKAYLSFDSAMAEVKSLGGVTAEQMAIMKTSAIGISKELPLSATNVARGFYMMRSAGFEAGRVIEELPAIARMAVAGNLEMADAVNSVTMVLDTYGERAGTAADITNVLMGTVQGFKTTLPELQMQLSKNVGVAASLGIEFHELAAMSGMLKKEFVNAEEAGTGMKTMLLRLVDPKVQAQLEGMGVEVKDANGNFIGMQAVLDSLSTTLKSAGGDVEQMAILQKLFGAEGVRAAMSLIRQKDSLAEFSAQVNAGVSVQEALNAVLESTQSQLTIAENKMDAARIQLGEGMAPATIFAANTMAVFAGVIEGMPGPLQSVAGSALIAGQSLIAIGPALAGIIPLMNMLKTAHVGAAISTHALTIATHAYSAAVWIMNTSLYACPLVWILGAIAAVVGVLYVLEKKFGVVTAAVKFLSDAIHGIIGFFGNMVDAIRGVTVDTDKLREADERLIEAQWKLEESEERVTEAEQKAAESAEDLAEISAELAAAQLEVADSAREVDALTEAYEELKGAMDAVADETENLDDLDRNLRSANLDLLEAQEKYSEAMRDSEASSIDRQRAAIRVETVVDRIEGIRKKQIETTEDLAKAEGEAAETRKKYGDESLSDMKANLDSNLATNQEHYANIAVLEAKQKEIREQHAFDQEDVDREKLVRDALLKVIEDTSEEKVKILEGEAKSSENILGKMNGFFKEHGGKIDAVLSAMLGPIGHVVYAFRHWDEISAKVGEVKGKIEDGMNKSISYLGTVVTKMKTKGKEFIGGIVKGIVAKYHEIRDRIEEGIQKALDYLTGLPGRFFDSGVAIINGIVDGIKSVPGKIAGAVAAEFAKVNPLKPHSDADEGPFSDLEASGKSVMTTFAKGIESERDLIGGSFGEALKSTPIAEASTPGPGGNSESHTYEGNSFSIGDVSLSRDYDFNQLMKDMENWQNKKRVQHGIRTI
jgi:TP901 family phage tail tape measure protein